jgi:hypothetical protein
MREKMSNGRFILLFALLCLLMLISLGGGELVHASATGSLSAMRTQFALPVGEVGDFNMASEQQSAVETVPPDNDDIANAAVVSSLPYNDTVDTTGATIEAGEPEYTCRRNYEIPPGKPTT